MLLAVDCGNTHIVMGIYDGENLLCYWRLASDSKRTADEYMILLNNLLKIENLQIADITQIAIASVVPIVTRCWQYLAQSYLGIEAFVIDSSVETGMPIIMDNPGEVGADRIADAVAAYDKYGGPLIVVDFGTATTFDCISVAGEYLGGAIMPGIEISQDALFAKAALLSKVPMQPPKRIPGKNTAECLQIGVFYGYAAQVDGIVAKLREHWDNKAKVIATGGLAQMICDYSNTIEACDPLLTLEGLKIIHDKMWCE